MCIACLAVAGFHYAVDNGMQSIESSLFVEAGEDFTFEEDDVYYTYVESAKLQKKLKDQLQRPTSWSYENYKAFQTRRIRTMVVNRAMMYGDEGWEKRVRNNDFDKLGEPS